MVILKNILTAKQKIFNKVPTQLDVLREIDKRNGLDRNKELKNELLRLERGYAGEQILVDHLEKYGEDHWVVLRNVWLDFYGGFESDVLLVTEAGLYTFEVKNFSGSFELKDNVATINNNEMAKDPISQGQKTLINLNNIFKHLPSRPHIEGSILFASADNAVKIYDSISKVNIIKRDKLIDSIWSIAKNERDYKGRQIDINSVLKKLDKHEIKNQFPARELFSALKKQIQPGIICCHCGGFNLKITKSYIICGCGMHEPRDEAIVRTICEYGVMNFNKNLTTSKLTAFFDNQISYSNVYSILTRYFEKEGAYRSSSFTNKKIIFPLVYNDFGFTKLKYKIIKGAIE